MPLYEYACRKCDHEFELLVQGGETPACPECESIELERLLSLPGAPKVSQGASLPMTCNTNLPPCGPGCCRI